MNGLPTLLNLGNRGIGTNALCPLCGKAPKSTQHALIFCEKVWEVWWHWQAFPISLLVETMPLWMLQCKFWRNAPLMTWRYSLSLLGPYGTTGTR